MAYNNVFIYFLNKILNTYHYLLQWKCMLSSFNAFVKFTLKHKHWKRTFWDSVKGTRGFTGKRIVNAATQFNSLFEVEEPEQEIDLDQNALDLLDSMV